jgi:hypothetical protein
MGKKAQLKQIISVIMIFMLLIQLTGCYSTRTIAVSDIKASDKYDIHSDKTLYPTFSNAVVSDSLLSGKLSLSKRNYGREFITHIYISSDSIIRINNYNDLISIPIYGISKIEHEVYDPMKTRINTSKTIGIILAVIGCVTFAVSGYTNMHTEENDDLLLKSGQVMKYGIGIALVGITVWSIGKKDQKYVEAGLVKFKGTTSANGIGLKVRF